MTLPDRPAGVVKWEIGLPPDLLQAIGHVAVLSAHIEEMLHKIYWVHAGLTDQSGPVVTDNLNPKRLSEDILKFANMDPAKANIAADLKTLLAEFESLNTKRNHCLHWIWSIASPKLSEEIKFGSTAPSAQPPFELKKPAYKQAASATETFQVKDVQKLYDDCAWLMVRLRAHTIPEFELRAGRQRADMLGATSEVSFADLFWPAPWLDRPLPPETPAIKSSRKS